MIHLVFETANIAALEAAIALDETLAGKIVEIKDDYAVGPLLDIYETEGYQARRNWWANVLEYSPHSDQLNIVDDKLTVHQLIQNLEEDLIYVEVMLITGAMITGRVTLKHTKRPRLS
jgi:hypothetical protein